MCLRRLPNQPPGKKGNGDGADVTPACLVPLFTKTSKRLYVVEDRRRDDTGDTCLTACWTALCCCCLWDMLT
uniref:Cysteine-rich and transmembrane domain-containing protein 1 n=1 Tax=Fundulus heteroclitus TaxID=8078 RepID=A0A3Q2NQE2_FUNHE